MAASWSQRETRPSVSRFTVISIESGAWARTRWCRSAWLECRKARLRRQELPWQEFERNLSCRWFNESEGFDVLRDLGDLGQSQGTRPFDFSGRRVVLTIGIVFGRSLDATGGTGVGSWRTAGLGKHLPKARRSLGEPPTRIFLAQQRPDQTVLLRQEAEPSPAVRGDPEVRLSRRDPRGRG